jgi:hypothetical protein
MSEKENCTCREKAEGGDICRSNDYCRFQMFGTFEDPTFCMREELLDVEKRNEVTS